MMSPLDFLKVAKKLLKYNSEANWRTSISRSYYAIHNFLKEEISGLGCAISSGSNAHGEIPKYLRGSKIVEAEDIGSKVADLQAERITADYRMHRTITQSTAKLIYAKAKRMAESFQDINKDELKKGIEEYKISIGSLKK